MKRLISLCLSLIICCGFLLSTPIQANAAGNIEAALDWAVAIANEDSHWYGRSSGDGPNYDCSSFVYWALRHAGFDVGGTVFVTGSMRGILTACGFTWIPWSQINNKDNLQRGDILLDESAHTEFYLGGGKNVAAQNSDDGIVVCNYWNGSEGVWWDGVLRYTESVPEKAVGHEISESEAAGRTIPDGDYCIQSTISSNFYIDPAPGSDIPAPNEANVSLYNFGDSLPPAHDTWTFTYLNNGFYKIAQKGTDMCMDVAEANMHSEANVHLWTYGGGANQMWSVRPVGNGYSIQAKHSGFYLDAAGGKPENCNIWVYESNGTAAQIFNLIDVTPKKPEKPIVTVNATDEAHPVAFSWAACDNADWYDVRIYKSDDTNIVSQMEIKDLSFTYSLEVGNYYANVASVNANGNYQFSDNISFTVSEAPTTLRFVAGREVMREVPVTATIEYPRGYIGSLFISYPSEYMQPVFNGDSDVLVNSESGVIEIMIDGAPESTYTKEFKMQLVEDIPNGEYKLTGELQDYHDPDDTERTLDYTANKGTISIYRPEKLDDIYGELTWDGIVSNIDIAESYRIIADSSHEKDAYWLVACDVNADGCLTSEDSEIIYQIKKGNLSYLNKWLDMYSKLDTEKLLKHELAIIDSGQCGKTDDDQVIWRLFGDGTLMIAGNGEMSDVVSSPWENYKNDVKQVIILEGITHIKCDAFWAYEQLEKVYIPETVTSIGDEAFFSCQKLKEISLPISLKIISNGAFCGCKSLESIVIPEGISKVESTTFADCANLKRVSIPESVTRICSFAFSNCNSLKIISIPRSVENIDSNAFCDCTSLTDIIINNSSCSIVDEEQTIHSAAVIHGYIGSTAQEYAEKYNRTFIPLDSGYTDTTTQVTTTTTKVTTTLITTTSPTKETTTTTTATTTMTLKLNATSITLTNGEQFQITANQNNLTYKSNNTNVAIVSPNGVVTAIGIGQAIITVIDPDYNVAQISINVVAVTITATTTITTTSTPTETTTTDTTTTTETTTTTPITPLDGDYNGDGSITVADAVLLARFVAEDKTLTPEQCRSLSDTDLDDDGCITILDVMIFLRKISLIEK